MSVNPNIAKTLGIPIPDQNTPMLDPDPVTVPPPVDPASLVRVDNDNLPDMSDIDMRLSEAEIQLEELIGIGRNMLKDLEDTLPNVEPKFRRGIAEQMTVAYGYVLDAVKHKTKLQLEKKTTRMKEAGFSVPKAVGAGGATNNHFFIGSHNEFLDMVTKAKKQIEDK